MWEGIAAAGLEAAKGLLNFGQQQSVLDWQKKMQRTAWSREDSAVQRRVADLKKAGLSPTLAAGSAASSSGPIQIKPAQWDGNPVTKGLDAQGTALALMSAKENIARTQAETELVRLQQEKTRADIANLEVMNPLRQQSQKIKNIIAEQTTDAVIQRAWQELRTSNSQELLNDVRAEYTRELEINARLDGLLKQVQVQVAEKARDMGITLGAVQEEYISKTIANRIAKNNADIWEKHGLPSTTQVGEKTQLGLVLEKLIEQIIDKKNGSGASGSGR